MYPEWTAPAATEIEVSVFGRGSGESILVHIGDGKWIVVDSLKSDGVAVPLLYLEGIGVDVQADVQLVLATHWHDDHIHGLADTYLKAKSAKAAFPLAMLRDEFLQFAAKFGGRAPPGNITSGVREFGHLLDIVVDREWAGVEPSKSWVSLLRHGPQALSHGRQVVVEALSPSSYDIVQFLGAMAADQQLADGVAMRAPHYDRNDVSCAVHITIGDDAVVLGADLENAPEPRSGWKAVFGAQQFPANKASLLKIPHHGSITGHHDEIWTRLCVAEPVTSLTPWARAGGRLPKRRDVERILRLAPDSYSAARTVTSGDRHRLQAVNSVLKRTNSKIRNVDQRLGHIRHRLDTQQPGARWRTDKIGAACDLSQVAA